MSQVDLSEEQAKLLDAVVPQIEELQAALEAENPGIEDYLQMINKNLRQFPELVHLLTDEQIKPIYSALRKQTDVMISVKASRSRGKKGLLSDGTSIRNLL